ncbi:MAG: heparinase II/III-family protein [Rhodospirillaceae bacterium]|nr:heparinase II/III-family protein [Rhodospirillaceae bacterium]
MRVLAAHATVIADRLEYFGDHHTSNHLSNNGRGLYLLGLELKLDKAASLGAEILCHEFDRIFSAEGVLREGSSHYQLLLTRNYAEAWLAAKRYERKEASMLKEFTLKALSAANAMTLPGGMPLIGDLSPDCSPAWLSGLLPGGTGGWLAGLVEDDVRAFLDLRRQIAPASSVALSAAGWHRLALGPFSMLAHVAPGGWSHMPGHGHQDIGGFELHYENEPVIVDPGRGSYGEEGEAAYYRSGAAHNGLMVDHASSFPPSRPYYDETFRRKIGGPVPQVEIETDTMTLVHHGFSRFPGVGAHKRCWHFAGNRLCVDDDLAGHSRHDLVRTIITPLKPRCVDGAIVLAGQQKEYRLSWQGDVNKMSIEPVTCWHSYGAGTAAHAIRMKKCVSLPWRGGFSLECL